MRHFLEVARTGLDAVVLHPLRSVVCFLALVVVLLPYLVGLGLAKGLEAEAEASVHFGADLYVVGNQFGRPVPIPLKTIEDIRQIPGVTAVIPRVVGEVVLGQERVHAVLVGLPPEHLPAWSTSVIGSLPTAARNPMGGGAHELVIGTNLARRLRLKLGSALFPFYRNNQGERLSKIVGLFKSDAPLWQSNLILTTLDAAETVFDQVGMATDLLIMCRPGYQDSITRTIEQEISFGGAEGRNTIRLKVTQREDLLAMIPRGLLHREGVFTLHFLLAFVVAILVLLVTSGLGLAERRREIGILKATGWQTDEILLRSLVESLTLSFTGACAGLLLAWLWLRVFNGYWIAGLFLVGVDAAPDFSVPFRLTPIPALLCFVFAFVVVLSGTLYSSWRAATVPPREAIR
jgi:ABC-type lipoprotein release transport system permease subunit